MLRLNIIGCGNVGKSLGRLWTQTSTFQIGDILNLSQASSESAAQHIGSGRPISSITEIQPADVYLIATGDDQIARASNALLSTKTLKPGSIVFHCSGSLSSEVMHPLKQTGAHVASTHPVKSFASACEKLSDFEGTFCGCEGDTEALKVLDDAFLAIGATTFPVEPTQKSLYHAASVISCNYLTALIELSALTYEKAGIPREIAMQIMQPMVQGTVDNIFTQGTTGALTGPIARGDYETVKTQLNAIENWQPESATIYKALGRVACELSFKQGSAQPTQLQEIQQTLSE